jgi:hypothetical protein
MVGWQTTLNKIQRDEWVTQVPYPAIVDPFAVLRKGSAIRPPAKVCVYVTLFQFNLFMPLAFLGQAPFLRFGHPRIVT